MRGAQIGILVLGLGLAGYGVYMAQSYISSSNAAIAAAQQAQNAARGVETVQVAVATRAIRYGEPVAAEDVRMVDWPVTSVPQGAFRDMASLVPENGNLRIALRAMEPSEPIMSVKVSDPGQSPGIAAQLQPGYRAFTLRVDSSSGISGRLRPSDMVDVYWSGRGETGDVTRILTSALRIIAIDENPDQDRVSDGVPRTVTIEARPEVVAALAQAQSTGRLSLSVVGLDDVRDLAGLEVDRASILGVDPTVAPVAEQTCSVRTRRGSDLVLIEIPCTN